MLGFLADKSIQSKIKAMYGQRLERNDFDEMLRKHSVSEIAGYLKTETYYGKILSNVQETMIHRGQLENMLEHHLFNDVKRLKKYKKVNNDLFDMFFMNIEIKQIVSCIGYIKSGQIGKFLVNVPGYLLGQLSIDLNKMVYAKNSSELLSILENTRYHKTILNLIEEKGGELPEASVCATELKKLFYNTFLCIIDKQYRGSERKELRKIILLQIETMNLATAFRLKRFFEADFNEIQKYIIPYYFNIHKSVFKSMESSKTVEEFMQKMLKTKIGRKIEDKEFDFIEYSMTKITAKNSKKMINFSTSPAVCCMAYIFFRQIELQNIINVVEGVRYKVSTEDIQKLLIVA